MIETGQGNYFMSFLDSRNSEHFFNVVVRSFKIHLRYMYNFLYIICYWPAYNNAAYKAFIQSSLEFFWWILFFLLLVRFTWCVIRLIRANGKKFLLATKNFGKPSIIKLLCSKPLLDQLVPRWYYCHAMIGPWQLLRLF